MPDLKERKKKTMYDPKSMKAEEFIDHGEVEATLAYADANRNNMPRSWIRRARVRA